MRKKIAMTYAQKKTINSAGFSLTELLIAIVIVGILSAVALPNYFNQVQRSRQSQVVAFIEQMMIRVSAYKDETGVNPTTWEDLSDISAIMTDNGPAGGHNGDITSAIGLPGSDYRLARSNNNDTTNNYYEFIAKDPNNLEYNVTACIDLENGASDLKIGTITSAPGKLVCR